MIWTASDHSFWVIRKNDGGGPQWPPLSRNRVKTLRVFYFNPIDMKCYISPDLDQTGQVSIRNCWASWLTPFGTVAKGNYLCFWTFLTLVFFSWSRPFILLKLFEHIMNTICDYFYFIFSPKKKAVNLLELNHRFLRRLLGKNLLNFVFHS